MRILAIDPGSEKSAVVSFDGHEFQCYGILANSDVLILLSANIIHLTCDHLAIEQVACYGMPVGAEVFQTVEWCGRFIERWLTFGRNLTETDVTRIKRADVKMHLCHATRGVNDGVIRQALIDRFGPGREKAIGTKAAPGSLHGIHKDLWSAVAVAVTWWDCSETG